MSRVDDNKTTAPPDNTTPGSNPSGGRRADIRSRFPVEPPVGSYNFPRSFERNWDVQWATGTPVSTVWAGRWVRGQIVRAAQPAFVLPPGHGMWDRTDPTQWHAPPSR